jgi:hypothetical protein
MRASSSAASPSERRHSRREGKAQPHIMESVSAGREEKEDVSERSEASAVWQCSPV